MTTFVYNRQQVTTREEKKKVAVILARLEKEGLLEKTGRIAGEYHIINSECDEIHFLDAEVKTVDLWLPFNLHNMVQIMPGNIIVVAGEPNAGKTAALLNIVRSNMDTWKTHYYSSEMGASELRNRLQNFDDNFPVRLEN